MKKEWCSLALFLVIFVFLAVLPSTESTQTCTCPTPPPSRPTNPSVTRFNNGLGLTPPMGWTNWNNVHCSVSEQMIRETADALVSTGLAKLGYQYVNIDDCWAEGERNAEGKLEASKTTFPSGIKALADYVHSKGLKLGIYSSAGTRTCSGTMPGSLGYEKVDAQTFAEWGIDYLKYDNCYTNDINPKIRYQTMSDALKNVSRPIFYNICVRGDMNPALWGPRMANSWRNTDDIYDNFERMLFLADKNEQWAGYAQPGGWNDPDVLEVGNGRMTSGEYRVQFGIWAMSKAPLIIAHDVRKMDSETFAILGNKEVIDINQDPLGAQARKYRLGIWYGRLSGDRIVLLMVNPAPYPGPMNAHWEDMGIANNTLVTVRDVWQHMSWEAPIQNNLTARVESHDCRMFVLTPINPTPATFLPLDYQTTI